MAHEEPDRRSASAAAQYQRDEILFEYGVDGRGTGVEFESLDERIEAPFDPEKIDIVTRNPTVDLLLSRLARGMLDLVPDFQRRLGIWREDQQSRLIESLLLRIPLPNFYAAENENGSWVIVDGIQRLNAIARFMRPETVRDDRLKLEGLEYLKQFEGMSFEELPPGLQIRLSEAELVVHLIRSGTSEEVKFNIFSRINSGGLPLTLQEIRHALYGGSARAVLADLAKRESFQLATGGSVSDERMADREMILRFLAFRITEPALYRTANFTQFLNDAMKNLKKLSTEAIDMQREEFDAVMYAAYDIFGEFAFRKQRRGQTRKLPINKAIFESVSVALAKLRPFDLGLLVERGSFVVDRFLDLMDDAEFDRAISVGTGDVRRVRYRFSKLDQLIEEVLADA